jgi:hypothetical protein
LDDDEATANCVFAVLLLVVAGADADGTAVTPKQNRERDVWTIVLEATTRRDNIILLSDTWKY